VSKLKKSEKRAAWFDQGMMALQRIAPEASGYMCPLCYRIFRREELEMPNVLACEHVPPRSLGGRELVLTCFRCNSAAGASVDAELSKYVTFQSFLRRDMRESRKARLMKDGHALNVLLRWNAEALEIIDYGNRNAPCVARGLENELKHDEAERRNWTLRLTLGNVYRTGWPEVSVLRAAYLAAFAKFGYQYIADAALDVVREWINNPNQKVVNSCVFPVPDALDDVRSIVLVKEPAAFRSLAVQIGKFRVFMPVFEEAGDLYERLAKPHEEKIAVELSGRAFPWPRHPEFLFDFNRSFLAEMHRYLSN